MKTRASLLDQLILNVEAKSFAGHQGARLSGVELSSQDPMWNSVPRLVLQWI
jgi:hypothetical protein